MSTRDDTAIVQLQVRLREDLRRTLEQAAKARRVSLNQEIVDRLQHTRDRLGLLSEVLELAYGPHRAGVLMLLGLVMARWWSHDWHKNPNVYEWILLEALAVLVAFRPAGRPGEVTPPQFQESAEREFDELMRALRDGPDALMYGPDASWRDTQTIVRLLGPLVQRIDDQRLTEAKRILQHKAVRSWLRSLGDNSPSGIVQSITTQDSTEPAPEVPPDTLDQARAKGAEAARTGKRIIDNPYPSKAQHLRAAWEEGWCMEMGSSDGMDIPQPGGRRKRKRPRPGKGKDKQDGDAAPKDENANGADGAAAARRR